MPEKIIQIIGLQRAGNHPIIDWIRSLFGSSVFHNDRWHDFFETPEHLETINAYKEECILVSFEDTGKRFVSGRNLVEDVVPVSPGDVPGAECHHIFILRDPYNNWASRVRGQEGWGLTGVEDLSLFIENWLYIAERWKTDPGSVILYNRWKSDRAYREEICARLGGTYSEETLNNIPLQGGGSSFARYQQRPSYRQMMQKLPYYFSGTFMKRLRKTPMEFLVRFFTPRPTAKVLTTDDRWTFITEREDCRPLFEDPRIRDASLEIFGFWIDASGKRHEAKSNAA